jgi:CDP-diacylglycerol--glycerol-3-phosphate 3-phosphatidyltransferase
MFFAVYFLCGISDILDGYIARKTNTSSRFGEILDSIADFIFVTVMLFIFIPLLAWGKWMLYMIGIIALVRFVSLGIGFVKYHAFAFLHTYANKITGIALICFPILYYAAGLTVTAFILCGIASLSALEELIITIHSKRLNRNVTSIFLDKYK